MGMLQTLDEASSRDPHGDLAPVSSRTGRRPQAIQGVHRGGKAGSRIRVGLSKETQVSSGQKAHHEEQEEQRHRERVEAVKLLTRQPEKLLVQIDEMKWTARWLDRQQYEGKLHTTYPVHIELRKLINFVLELP
jgi:hypothetical protein